MIRKLKLLMIVMFVSAWQFTSLSQPVVKDKTFFEGITYSWPINVAENDRPATNKASLAEIATDPDQMIAMLREIYTNKSIPGNHIHGYDAYGNPEDNVLYSAVGEINSDGSDYGWNIRTTDLIVNEGRTVFNPMEFWPQNEGITLILVEVNDGVNIELEGWKSVYKNPGNYNELKEAFNRLFKSMRVVSESMRVGEGYSAGTLFKIDCDQMNRFFFLAKGQLRTMYMTRNNVTIAGPYLINGEHTDTQVHGPFFHMFEQMSPYDLVNEEEATDVYLELVNLGSFAVQHDCNSIPYPFRGATPLQSGYGHEFNLYGHDSESSDCQDVRDLMFLVPDYRMTYYYKTQDDQRDTYSSSQYLQGKYRNYNPAYRPKMGLFSIIQDPINGQRVGDKHLYELTLNWRSNLVDFMQEGNGEYKLFQVVIENGVEKYEPVYYMNQGGDYIDAEGNVVSEPIQITITAKNLSSKGDQYTPIYVDMLEHSQQVTFAIQAQSTQGLIMMQMSNKRSFIIPGYDLTQKLELHIDDDYTGRFDPKRDMNFYSNGVMINSFEGSIATDFLKVKSTGEFIQDQITIYRKAVSRDATANEENDLGVAIATATVTSLEDEKGTLQVKIINETQTPREDFPTGYINPTEHYAGYHANTLNNDGLIEIPFTIETTNDEKYVIFKINGTPTFKFYDNFCASTAKNEHPTEYVYQAKMIIDPAVQNLGNEGNLAESNKASIHLPTTEMQMLGAYTLDYVVNDKAHADQLPETQDFQIKVKNVPQSEILRYDAYRWEIAKKDNREHLKIITEVYDDEGSELDVAPNGIVSNNGNGRSSVAMNGRTQSQVPFEYYGQEKWASFQDSYPKTEVVDEFIYCPVIETFSGNLDKYKYYNTYGAPSATTASGKLTIQPGEVVGAMNFEWTTADGKTYTYYNAPVTITELEVPDGYEVYKVRAWRLVNPDSIAERTEPERGWSDKLPNRLDRLSGDYLFEEMNFGEFTSEFSPNGMSKNSLKGYSLGSRAYPGEDPQPEETVSTFGAIKLKDDEKLSVTFIVRVYFVRTTNRQDQYNPLVNASSVIQGAPRRAEGIVADPDSFDYYIAEAKATTTLTDKVITGISRVDSPRQVAAVTYYNPMGQASSRPFSGLNIIVTRYTDGSTSTHKEMK